MPSNVFRTGRQHSVAIGGADVPKEPEGSAPDATAVHVEEPLRGAAPMRTFPTPFTLDTTPSTTGGK